MVAMATKLKDREDDRSLQLWSSSVGLYKKACHPRQVGGERQGNWLICGAAEAIKERKKEE